MIIKSYEIKKNTQNFFKYNFYLLYGENVRLKNDIGDIIKISTKQQNLNMNIINFSSSVC